MANTWDAWLRKVEYVGFCWKYQEALKSFDSLEQIEKLYVRENGENKVLDPSFYEDVGVQHKEHQRLFAEYLSGNRITGESKMLLTPAPTSVPVPDTKGPELAPLDAKAVEPAQEPRVAMINGDEKRIDPEDEKSYTFREFEIKCRGSFSQDEIKEYWDTECIPDVPAITPATSPTPGEATKSADVQPMMPSKELKSSNIAFIGKACALWLDEVQVNAAKYINTLENNFDAVEQIIEAYTSACGTAVDVDTFCSDVGVIDVDDRKKFGVWFQGKIQGPSAKFINVEHARAVEVSTHTKAVAASAPVSALGEFASWLNKIDSSGSLNCYVSDLEDNYDNVSQIEDLYVTSLEGKKAIDPRFFDDIGIENKDHQTIFIKFFSNGSVPELTKISEPLRSPELLRVGAPAMVTTVGSPFKDWLRKIDPSGGLDVYLKELEDNFDSYGQIEELYVSVSQNKKTFDPQFFEDMCIENKCHQTLFSSFFTSDLSDAPPKLANGASDLAQPGTTAVAGGSVFADWLRKVDPHGNLDVYCQRLEENYDGSDQIEELYVSEKLGKKKFDDQFFEDIAVEDESHKALFTQFFTGGSTSVEPVKPLEPTRHMEKVPEPAKSSAPVANILSTFKDWLNRVDPAGGLIVYLKEFEENYDGHDQIEELYVTQNAGKKMLDPQFFEDMGIQNKSHQALFIKFYLGVAALEPSQSEQTPKSVEQPTVPLLIAAEGSTFAGWLRKVDPSGGLDGYLKDLEENFDTPDQIEELYTIEKEGKKTFDPQFFEDIGVTNTVHQSMFNKLYSRDAPTLVETTPELPIQQTKNVGNEPVMKSIDKIQPATEVQSEFAEWLRRVDPSGRLDSYLQILEDNYDGCDQIEELYVTDKDGKKTFDPQFFEDTCVSDTVHQSLFANFYEKNVALAPPSVTPPKLATSASDSSAAPQTSPTVSVSVAPVPAFSSWLQKIDPSGTLNIYANDCQENFDSLEQLEELYVNGNDRKLDPQFFEDMGIEDATHIHLFEAYYNGGTATTKEVPAEEDTTLLKLPPVDGKLPFGEWLKQVDPSNSLSVYKADLEENYDDLEQLLDLYVINVPGAEGQELDPQFFEDMGVEDSGHRALFKVWFAKVYAPAP